VVILAIDNQHLDLAWLRRLGSSGVLNESAEEATNEQDRRDHLHGSLPIEGKGIQSHAHVSAIVLKRSETARHFGSGL
jgi:hypothetical protein